MPTTSRQQSRSPGERIDLDQAEAALVEQYARLVRLAYLVLPPSVGRHRRVLAAHGIVQRALPGTGSRLLRPAPRRVPSPRGARDRPGYAWVREQILREALAHERRPRWWPGRLPPPRVLRPGLPVVWGLRFFPRAGGTEELALDQALSKADGAARAALALSTLEGLPEPGVREVLSRLGVTDTSTPVVLAGRLARDAEGDPAALVRSAEFDPSSVRTRPTDLLRRRHRVRLGMVLAAAVVAAALLLTLFGTGAATLPSAGPAPVPRGTGALDPRGVVDEKEVPWDDTSRVDFTAWPTRGERTGDEELLARALNAWAHAARAVGGAAATGEHEGVRVTRAPGTPLDAPPRSPKLLFAGDVDGSAVVLLHDGQRAVRYARPLDGKGDAALDVVRTDDADVTTAAALVLSRTRAGTRYLTAPWVDGSTTRDLLRPDTPAAALAVSRSGVTDPVPGAPAGGSCAGLPVLQLRSSARIVENHSFLLADLGDLTPVHLTYTPLPGSGAPARQPREATGPAALLAWARLGCRLDGMRGLGVRSVNTWDFARQDLPEKGGRAVWACTRADTWRGPGDVLLSLRTPASAPAAPVDVVGRARATAACSRFGQHVVAGAHWRSPAGHWYVVGAGSRAVTALRARGAVSGVQRGTSFARRAPEDARVRFTGDLADGGTLRELPHEKG